MTSSFESEVWVVGQEMSGDILISFSLRIWFVVARRVEIWRLTVSRRVSAQRAFDELNVWKQRVMRAMAPRVVMALGDKRVAIAIVL